MCHHYKLLGVRRGATPAKIEAALRRLRSDLEGMKPDDVADRAIHCWALTEAYCVLSDGVRRARHDRVCVEDRPELLLVNQFLGMQVQQQNFKDFLKQSALMTDRTEKHVTALMAEIEALHEQNLALNKQLAAETRKHRMQATKASMLSMEVKAF